MYRRDGTGGTVKNFVYFANFIPRECKDVFFILRLKDTHGRRALLSFFFFFSSLLVILSRQFSLSLLHSRHNAALCLWKEKVKECSGAVKQRETLEPGGMGYSRGNSRKTLQGKKCVFLKREMLLKNSISQVPKELHSRGKRRTHLQKSIQLHYWSQQKQVDKISNEKFGRQELESGETGSHPACCTEITERPWASYCPFLCVIFPLHIK